VNRPGLFTRRNIAPAELPWIMRRHIVTGCMGTVWGTLVNGILFTWFGNAVGMTQFHWGVLGAIGAWVVLVQPLGALLGSRFGSRKGTWFWFALGERVVRFAAIAGGYVAWLTARDLVDGDVPYFPGDRAAALEGEAGIDVALMGPLSIRVLAQLSNTSYELDPDPTGTYVAEEATDRFVSAHASVRAEF